MALPTVTSITSGIDSKKIMVNNKPMYLKTKRIIDILGAALGLLFLSWMFVIIALLIKFEDPKGAVFFKQLRVGKDGKEFSMYKFRSMVSNAEELLDSLIHLNETTGAMFKMKKDPRITRIGIFIRKTSIDELPQLWNVLKGEMSLVGPRPPLYREVQQYTEYDKQRLLVTPGCTGLWQVSGRSSLGFEQMIKLDLEYIEKRTVTLDIMIILKTFKAVFFNKEAY